MRIQDAKRTIKRPADEPTSYPDRKRPAPAPTMSSRSGGYDDRRYAASRDSGRAAAGAARGDYGRGEDRRVSERSERYDTAPRRDYDRRGDYDRRSSRDMYDSKGG